MFEPDRWVEHLDAHRISYVLVGGYGATLHGAQRPTYDIDVVPAWDLENLARLCDALRAVDGVSTTGPRAEGDAVTPEVLIEREVTTWQTSLGRIDVLVGIPDADGMPVGYEALQQGAIALRPAGTDIDVEVADLGDIIISKEFAGRSKDTQALPELRRIAGQASDLSRPDR